MGLKQIDSETGESYTLDMTPDLRADLERHWAAECKHPSTSIRRAVVANGAIQYRHQCLVCGVRIGSAIKKGSAPPNCPDVDLTLDENHQRARESALTEIYQRHIRKQKRAGEGYQEKYQAYLRSEIWISKKKRVLQRANNTCEGCLEEPATQVHHMTYAHVFDELLYELVAICDKCHAKAHLYEAVTEGEHQELPCVACRFGAWSETGGSLCGKFNVSTGMALARDGPCGPNAKELEPLR